MKPFVRPTGKCLSKKPGAPGGDPDADLTSGLTIQAKLVLLTLTFPRVRIIWSSSPYATANIFNDLKNNAREPDYHVAVAVGAEEDPEAGAGVNMAAEELLRTIPGITAKNVKYVMGKVGNVRGLCDMSSDEVKALLGAEPGKACWDFLHWGEREKHKA